MYDCYIQLRAICSFPSIWCARATGCLAFCLRAWVLEFSGIWLPVAARCTLKSTFSGTRWPEFKERPESVRMSKKFLTPCDAKYYNRTGAPWKGARNRGKRKKSPQPACKKLRLTEKPGYPIPAVLPIVGHDIHRMSLALVLCMWHQKHKQVIAWFLRGQVFNLEF